MIGIILKNEQTARLQHERGDTHELHALITFDQRAKVDDARGAERENANARRVQRAVLVRHDATIGYVISG